MEYTEQKKAAIRRVLTSQAIAYEKAIGNLKSINDYLDSRLTLDDLPIRVGLQQVIGTLRYEKEIIDSFKKDLGE